MSTVHATETMHQHARPVARIVYAVRNFLRAWKNRRDFYRLGEMSDAELADIGLTRSDLHVVVDLPFGRDPTVHLGPLAEIRRREIEAAARQSC
ncbi:MAG: DUF1127 domain-containing protein [Rhizobiaceae bacterium]|nr:DUF1127 domain-containing protein [Rhizobiaceae bacterium]